MMLRAGIVGCGFMGRMHANVYKIMDDVELVAAVDYHPERLEKFTTEFGLKGYDSLEAMAEAENLDIIDICVPTHVHHEYTLRAAKLGRQIFCEKPMARTAEQASEMVAAANEAGVRLMIGHCIRFWPEYALLKEIVDDQRLGKLLSINLTRYGGFPAWASDGWNYDEAKCGGGVLDMHIHDTDFILYLLGEPDSMESTGNVDEKGPGHVFTTMRYRNTVAHLEGGWNLPTNAPFKMAFRAIFERGCIIMDACPMTIFEEGKDPVVPEFEQMEASGGGNLSSLGGYYHELRYFVDSIKNGTPLEIVTPETSLQSLEYTLKEIELIKAKIK